MMRQFNYLFFLVSAACIGLGGGCLGDDHAADGGVDGSMEGGAGPGMDAGDAGTSMDADTGDSGDSGPGMDGSDRETGPENTDGAAGSEGGRDGENPINDGGGEGGTRETCGHFGDKCKTAADCCSGLCDPESDTCISSLIRCAEAGEACTLPTDCCTLRCVGGECKSSACVSDGESCTKDHQCCSTICTDESCQALNVECKTAGNACGNDGECCSGLCDGDRCSLAASFCIQEGDICGRPEDCCTGRCEIAEGREIGICGPPPSGSSFCNDGIEGSICDGCNDCCSRLCAPYGPTGVYICQPASGCHVTGDFCRADKDCCGAPGTGLPGEGNVECEKEEGSDLGICRNPRSCSPQGNICHFKDYAECNVSSARANCCSGPGANKGECKLDPLGVPRCTGLGDECIEPGEICASSDDCCDDLPCVPDEDGILRCMIPPDGGTPCVPVDGPCTIDADCCPGNVCIRPHGSTEGTCGELVPPPEDGGVPDSGTTTDCALYGQYCEDDPDCCNDIPCTDNVCRVPIG
jgi:hypothetical protein